MFNILRKIAAAPIFDDEENNRVARILNTILLFITSTTSLATPILWAITSSDDRLSLLILLLPFLILNIIATILLKRGYVTAASNIFLITLSVAIFGSYLFSHSSSTGSLLSLTIVIAFTTLLLRPRAIIVLLAIIIAFTFITITAQTQGWITPAFTEISSPLSNWFTNSFVFVLTSLGLYFSSVSLRRALDSAFASKKLLEVGNKELESLQTILEKRVQTRTQELEKRASQLETISSVARSTAALQEMDELLPSVAQLIFEGFGFYHIGIFLIDNDREYAELKASNSSGGSKMLNRQHKLKLDAQSIVGFVTSQGQPRIALDVGTDAVFFDNPDLPDTRSEMALPLRVGGRVIGALDVQSTESNAFSEDDVAILSTLSDQVAIAIENARLFSESGEALKKSEESFSQYIKQEWSSFARQAKAKAYKFDGNRATLLDEKEVREKAKEIPKTGRLSLEKATRELSVPIRFRGQVIGVLDVKAKSGNRKWTSDDIALIEAAVERTALALENARLVESSQRRASRERTIGEISTKIGAVSDLDAIMQTAVEELGRKIGGAAEVIFELDTVDPK